MPSIVLYVIFIVLTAVGCVQQRFSADAGWVTLLDGSPSSLDNSTRVGDANWRTEDGIVTADHGNGFLVSKKTYADFQIRAEFWVDADANSGILIRLADPVRIE